MPGTALERSRWVPVEHLQGDAHQLRFDFTHTVDDAPAPRDMAGYQFTAQIRSRPGSGRVLAQLEVDDTNSSTGIVLIKLTPEQSSALRPGVYRFDAQWVFAGEPLTFAMGDWTVIAQVTR